MKFEEFSKEEIVEFFMAMVSKLEARIKELEDQLSKNSHNSGKPPSSDVFSKVPGTKSLRKSSNKKSGAQKSHKGKTLEMVDAPDEIIVHNVTECENCHNDIKEVPASAFDKRQVFDIPHPKMEITEHRVVKKECPFCRHSNEGLFPENVSQKTQYGTRIRTLCVYLSQYQHLPSARTVELISNLFGHSLSEGSLYNFIERVSNTLKPTSDRIKTGVLNSPVVHFDETGIYCSKSRRWLHVASTKTMTYYAMHEKRGATAMDEIGILPQFKGIAVHDYWKPYLHYNSSHAFCNVHHLRELNFIYEQYKQSWAPKLKLHLLEIKDAVDNAKKENSVLTPDILKKFERKYSRLTNEGFKQNVDGESKKVGPEKRGRIKRSPSLNLLRRFKKHKKEILAFMYDFQVPFDNNQAERDIRMMKVKQKISGTFRSVDGANYFCRIRSYLSTAAKNQINAFSALSNLIEGRPFSPIN